MVMRNTGCHRDLLRQVAERGAPGPSGKHPHIQGSFPLKQWRIPALDKYYVQVLKLFTISINSIWILGPLGFVLDFATKYSWPLLNILNKSIYQILEESKGWAGVGQEAIMEGLFEKVRICWAHKRHRQFLKVEEKREWMLKKGQCGRNPWGHGEQSSDLNLNGEVINLV